MRLFIILPITLLTLATSKATYRNTYILYNRNYTDGVTLNGSADDVEKFIIGEPCNFVTGGFLQTYHADAVQYLVESYLRCRFVNVIAVDWSPVSLNILFPLTIYETQLVSDDLAKKIVELINAGACTYNETHCIGHSLGAHVCGGAGKIVQKLEGKNISRVTGLDPAGPGYQENPVAPSNNMSSSDADFVDAIHTDHVLGQDVPQRESDSGGEETSLAQANFVLNGGRSPQPGCIPIPLITNFCSHWVSYQVYAISICEPYEYPSTQCGSYKDYEDGNCEGNPVEYMGEDCPPTNYTDGVTLNGSADDVEKFIIGEPCNFVTGGFLQTYHADAVQYLVESYLRCRFVNVIAVDWSPVSLNILFPLTIYETQLVSDDLAKKIVELINAGACTYNETHCIGHSLGAHVCGGAGKIVQKLEGKNISRVTGLDPAGPGYQENPVAPSNNMSSSDADFVDAIHTDHVLGQDVPQRESDSGGEETSLAQANFVLNGGRSPQPGCIPIPLITNFCSHWVSYQVYAISICEPYEYPSTQCGSYKDYEDGNCEGNPVEYMGEDCPPTASGVYYDDSNNTMYNPEI